jgi:regulator of protease activity HflC (stomatin/prohibitin superfamily)
MGLEGFGEWITKTIDQLSDYIKPWVVVNHYSEAIVLRFGVYHRTLKPGTHLKWPIIEYPLTWNVKEETMESKPLTITTLDNETISIGGVVTYEIHDLKKFLLDNNDSPSNMSDSMSTRISSHLEDVSWEDIKKKVTRNAIKRALTTKYLDFGVTVKDFDFSDKCKTRAFKFFTEKDKSNIML